jgi:hypothetical protein
LAREGVVRAEEFEHPVAAADDGEGLVGVGGEEFGVVLGARRAPYGRCGGRRFSRRKDSPPTACVARTVARCQAGAGERV